VKSFDGEFGKVGKEGYTLIELSFSNLQNSQCLWQVIYFLVETK
jgi:hypothetical protein